MKLIIVGHGMVGHKFLECLAEAGAQNVEVTVLCEEPRPAYDRVHLSEFFAGKSAEDLSLVPAGFFEQHNNMLLRLNARAVEIDRAARTVTVSTGVMSAGLTVDCAKAEPDNKAMPAAMKKNCLRIVILHFFSDSVSHVQAR